MCIRDRACIWNGEYACGLDARALAGICQYAENTYFGKPSGQLDQLALSLIHISYDYT